MFNDYHFYNLNLILYIQQTHLHSSKSSFYFLMAGVERIELPTGVLETIIIPFNYTPVARKL